jgi:hypothetical protein
MKTIAVMAAALMLLGAQDAPVAEPGWMAGEWIEAKGDAWAEEFWTHARGGLMIGAGRTGKGEKLTGWEAMRIVRGADGKLSFVAQPGGAPPSSFPMVSSGEREIVFANPAHDYPQKIRYWRDEAGLNAEISLIDGSKAQRFAFKPMRR